MSAPMPAANSLEAFARSWSVTVLRSAPLIAPARHFVYPKQVAGEEDALSRGALLLEVRPASGKNFLAACALGFRDPAMLSGVWACPSPAHLLAVAGGYAYRIDTREPFGCDLLEQRPVTSILPAPEAGLLLLAGFHDVLAIGPEGVCWRSGRLSWEGLTMHAVQGQQLHGQGWDMFADAELPFTVDLRTGAHAGGGYRRV